MGGREGLEVRLESNFKTALKVTENKRDFFCKTITFFYRSIAFPIWKVKACVSPGTWWSEVPRDNRRVKSAFLKGIFLSLSLSGFQKHEKKGMFLSKFNTMFPLALTLLHDLECGIVLMSWQKRRVGLQPPWSWLLFPPTLHTCIKRRGLLAFPGGGPKLHIMLMQWD